jgi:hypothetical protein
MVRELGQYAGEMAPGLAVQGEFGSQEAAETTEGHEQRFQSMPR